jgi:hypothetical protein
LIDIQPQLFTSPRFAKLFNFIDHNLSLQDCKVAQLRNKNNLISDFHKSQPQNLDKYSAPEGALHQQRYLSVEKYVPWQSIRESYPHFCESQGRWVKLNPSRDLKGAP